PQSLAVLRQFLAQASVPPLHFMVSTASLCLVWKSWIIAQRILYSCRSLTAADPIQYFHPATSAWSVWNDSGNKVLLHHNDHPKYACQDETMDNGPAHDQALLAH